MMIVGEMIRGVIYFVGRENLYQDIQEERKLLWASGERWILNSLAFIKNTILKFHRIKVIPMTLFMIDLVGSRKREGLILWEKIYHGTPRTVMFGFGVDNKGTTSPLVLINPPSYF